MPSDALPDDSETLKAMLLAERVQNERLRQIIRELQRHRFGRRAETLPEDQMLLGLEDVEQAEANCAAETDGSSPSDRQVRAHKRRINRGTLADWVGHAAWHLRPLHERLLMRLKELPRLFADETTAPVLDPGRGRTKTGQLWSYAADDRPWGGSDPPGVAYVYAPDRKAERPIAHLDGFKGILQVDGYAGYRKLAERGDVRLAFCWSHVRRNFYELAVPGSAPIASEALEHIAALYAVDKDIRGRSADERRAVRQQKSRPRIDALEPWLRAKLGLTSQKGKLAKAIRYARSRWEGLN